MKKRIVMLMVALGLGSMSSLMVSAAPEGFYDITIDYNYDGAPEGEAFELEEDECIEEPDIPVRDGYVFQGWYTDSECNALYNFDTEIAEDISLYAGWKEEGDTAADYIFEAEYTDLTGIAGGGFSSNPMGKDLIGNGADASNGGYLAWLCKEGCKITFEITSDQAAEAVLEVRLGANVDFAMNPEKYTICVNDEKIVYDEISLQMNQKLKNYELGVISLKEGTNVITFETTNSDTPAAGLFAVAPTIDYMKLSTDAVLTWEPKEENMQ